jgi:hypothetical protein
VYFAPAPRVTVVGGGVRVQPGSASHPDEFHETRPASSIGDGRADGKAALLIAVVALIALPVVVYALDDGADPLVVQRFYCPSFAFEGFGGVSFFSGQQGGAPLFLGRATAAYGHLGTDFQFDLTSAAGGFSTHALLRLTPKQHLEGTVALGYRWMTFQGAVRDGFEVGLPHRYVFSRSGLNSFGLELRPMLLISPRGVDGAVEANLVVPLFELLHARVGGRVHSFGSDLIWTLQGGLAFAW